MAGTFAEKLGALRPQVVVVEPENAACLLASIRAGRLVQLEGDLVTAMEMLSCGEPSAVAWTVVARRVDAFMAISDGAAVNATACLRGGSCGDEVIDVGVSGAAGFAGLLVSLRSEAARSMLALGEDSRVLVIGTEGANPLD
jgi:diaminopropionate ammonia-lyase